MGPRPFDLLLDLLTHAGRVVGKAELFERVWHGVAVTDNALTRAMKDLRRAIGDRASSPRYIDTVARRGYRFVADVRDLPIGRHVTVMVLPFDDLSAAPQAYIADGLADELIAQLGHANPDQLTVIGRASASAIGASDRPWAAAARRLGVDYAVRGSVRREGDRTRVSVQLIRLLDEASEWTEAFEAGRTGAFEARHELAEAIAGHLRVQLAERATTTPARLIDPDAHAAFLEGRHFLRTRTADGMAKAAGAFERAIASIRRTRPPTSASRTAAPSRSCRADRRPPRSPAPERQSTAPSRSMTDSPRPMPPWPCCNPRTGSSRRPNGLCAGRSRIPASPRPATGSRCSPSSYPPASRKPSTSCDAPRDSIRCR